MKKIFTLIIISIFCTASCLAQQDNITVYNLKEKNMYLLNMNSKVEKIEISNKKILNIIPITTINNDKRQLFIDAVENGVCDVNIVTADENHKIRFITGSLFQDTEDNLIQIDLPAYNSEEKK